MTEPRNGLTSLLRAWPILVTVLGVVGGLVSWQFVVLHRMVDVIQQEHRSALPLVAHLPELEARLRAVEAEQYRRTSRIADIDELRKGLIQVQTVMETRQGMVAIVEVRLAQVESELKHVRTVLEDIKRSLTVQGR